MSKERIAVGARLGLSIAVVLASLGGCGSSGSGGPMGTPSDGAAPDGAAPDSSAPDGAVADRAIPPDSNTKPSDADLDSNAGKDADSSTGACAARTVDLSSLPASAAPNPTAYAALKVPAMAAGTAFVDPVTKVRMVKLTDSSTPASSQFGPMYSTLGLQISQPWGACLDQYTIFFISVTDGDAYLVDYTLGGAPTNYRTAPVNSPGSGMSAFSRLPGQAQIMYISTGTELHMYDTGKNAYADKGMFPIAWTNGDGWLQLNHDETWATGLQTAGIVTALNLTTGAVHSHTMSGLDEMYSGYGNVALINCDSGGSGATAAYWWDLDTDTTTSLGLPYGDLDFVSHVPSLNGYWMAVDSNTGGGHMPLWQVKDDLTHDQLSTLGSYWGQYHQCGHWQQAAGDAQYFLWSTWGEANADGSSAPNYAEWTAALKWNLVFIRSSDASTVVLGHHYSISPYSDTGSNSALEYWSQPHATQSTDGVLVLYGSNMNVANGRIDAFLAEVPTAKPK
jgi:hypothetical protein